MNNEVLKDNISIVTVCDNNYVMLLATLLKSIERNNKSKREIDFYIVNDNITRKNQVKFEKSFNNDLINIKWLIMADLIPNGARVPTDKSTYPLNIYIRLFIPYFMPQEIERVIYLDVDMVVLGNIGDLWNTDLSGNIIGAVQDTFGTAFYGIKNHKDLGISEDSKYFNSGMLLIDTIEWRKNGITEDIIVCLQNNTEFAQYPDQYGLNVVFANKWFEMDEKWNTYTYKDEEDPLLIHYIGYKPIYKDYSGKKEYLDLFFYYLNLTQWKGMTPVSKYFRYALKFKTRVKKKLTKLLSFSKKKNTVWIIIFFLLFPILNFVAHL